MTAKPFLESKAIINSLRIAINSAYNLEDIKKSLQRLRGMLAHFSEESLFITHDGNRIRFYEWVNNKKTYLKKSSDKLYALARKRYLTELQKILLMRADPKCKSLNLDHQFDVLAKLIRDYDAGNLELARIVLTQKQYAWFTGRFRQKLFVPDDSKESLFTKHGVPVRSKSEQNVGNKLIDFGIADHYEEQLKINVSRLINVLESDLRQRNLLNGLLYYYQGNNCIWNVPKELQWMNATGSVWRTYDSRTGCLTIYPDFTIMLIDGNLLYWEHEGLLDKFVYRANATERIALMRLCEGISLDNLIETNERESNDDAALEEIIQTKILPRFWF